MKKGLALFDFDGTITTHDTLFEIIKFQKGEFRFWTGMLVLSPMLLLMKAGLIENARAKEITLQHFFKGLSIAEFAQKCNDFTLQALPKLMRPEALAKIKHHQQNNDRIIIVSASAVDWIEPWSKTKNIELLASRLEKKDGRITGKLESLNCNGPEKVNRIKAHLNLDEYSPIYAYGDSSGDREMLQLADYPFLRKF